jgi:hypothetical protein
MDCNRFKPWTVYRVKLSIITNSNHGLLQIMDCYRFKPWTVADLNCQQHQFKPWTFTNSNHGLLQIQIMDKSINVNDLVSCLHNMLLTVFFWRKHIFSSFFYVNCKLQNIFASNYNCGYINYEFKISTKFLFICCKIILHFIHKIYNQRKCILWLNHELSCPNNYVNSHYYFKIHVYEIFVCIFCELIYKLDYTNLGSKFGTLVYFDIQYYDFQISSVQLEIRSNVYFQALNFNLVNKS